MLEFVNQSKLLSRNQFEVVTDCSTTLKFLRTLDNKTWELDQGKEVDITYIVFETVLGLVLHIKQSKLRHRIWGNTLDWLALYLANWVAVKRSEFSCAIVLSGAPQRSV